jgi:hypothetical protein
MHHGNVSLVKKLMRWGASPWQGSTFDNMPWHEARTSCRQAAIAHLFETAHDGKASHDNTPEGFVRQLILRKMHSFDGILTEDDFHTIENLIDEELCVRYPPPSPHDATTTRALDGSPSPLTNDQMPSPYDGATGAQDRPFLELGWASEEMEEAYTLQCNFSWLLAAISSFITALFNNSNNSFRGDMQFMKRKRPPCLTMPWTIWPSLVVLWGVCWMFIYSHTPEQFRWLADFNDDVALLPGM